MNIEERGKIWKYLKIGLFVVIGIVTIIFIYAMIVGNYSLAEPVVWCGVLALVWYWAGYTSYTSDRDKYEK